MPQVSQGQLVEKNWNHSNKVFPKDPTGQKFCEIFGTYLWQVIEADLPESSFQKPLWETIRGYPIRPRVLWTKWQDANTLIGVRFGKTTSYALIDVDSKSCYHSQEGISQIRAALETIGITRTLLVRSSWSGGFHLYIPLAGTVSSFSLAVCLAECLKAQDLHLKAGQLEIFPNVKSYGVSIFIEYQAHRLPLQPGSGSCLLNDALQPVTDNLDQFLKVWDNAAQAQDTDLLEQAIATGRNVHRKRPKRLLSNVEVWQKDLEAEIADGWTAHGQTNTLLKSIACYGHVFERLRGEALTDYIVRIAVSRPGYQKYCRHQHEIRRRAIAWARAAEKYYWPLGSQPEQSSESHITLNENEVRSHEARHRIQAAVALLLEQDVPPQTVREWVASLVKLAKTSAQTLYKHLALWHPHHRQKTVGGVTATVEPVSKHNARVASMANFSPKHMEIKALHTSEKIMKCGEPVKHEVGSEAIAFFPDRGVRGEEMIFPQAPTLSQDKVQTAIQHQIRQLKWTGQQACTFIAEHFDGRSWSQLLENEWVALLYHLRCIAIANSSQVFYSTAETEQGNVT